MKRVVILVLLVGAMGLLTARSERELLRVTGIDSKEEISNLASVVDACPGKQSWPELVGVQASLAKRIIELENPHVKGIYIGCGAPRILDFRCDRVWIDVVKPAGACVKEPIVCRTPRVG